MTNILNDLDRKDEDTMEYWVDQASKGRNKAECWQNCNRIADEWALKKQIEVLEEVLVREYFDDGSGYQEVDEERIKSKLGYLKSQSK